MSIIRSAPPDRGRRFTSHFFLRFSVNFLTFPPYEQHIFIHDKRSLCFLRLTDLNIHKPCKTQASWVSATDSYGEKSLPALQLHFACHQNHCVCKQPYLTAKRWLYMSVLCSVSERIHRNLPEEAQVLCHAFKNKNTSNQLKQIKHVPFY